MIETKNLEGKIKCIGDSWYQYKESWKLPIAHEIKSPSRQVKRNAVFVKKLIDESKKFHKNIWVEGIVVFTNPDVELELNSPTVTVLKVGELPEFVESRKPKSKFSLFKLKAIGRILMNGNKTQINQS